MRLLKVQDEAVAEEGEEEESDELGLDGVVDMPYPPFFPERRLPAGLPPRSQATYHDVGQRNESVILEEDLLSERLGSRGSGRLADMGLPERLRDCESD